jgi:hypothetical protein
METNTKRVFFTILLPSIVVDYFEASRFGRLIDAAVEPEPRLFFWSDYAFGAFRSTPVFSFWFGPMMITCENRELDSSDVSGG